jgi:hypothetical protein
MDMLRERVVGYHQARATLDADVELNRQQVEYVNNQIADAVHEDTLMLHWGYITRDTLDILSERYHTPYEGQSQNIRTKIWTVRRWHDLREWNYADMRNRQNGNEIGNVPQPNRIAQLRRMRELEDERHLRDMRERVMQENAAREHLEDENFADRWIREQNERIRHLVGFNAPAGGAGRNVAPLGELQRFVRDSQNVHTETIVNQTKEIVQKIREIQVPPEYRWTATETSKTPFEIGLECKLSQRAALQMMTQYSQDISIYDIESGIYGKVLDSVWQYVKASPDKNDLCKILKQEMEDNIGMCAQGNLSRLCNILAGYMDGVKQKESTSEILGRLFPKLMELDDEDIRVLKGVKILVENNVPQNEWQTWLEPLRT